MSKIEFEKTGEHISLEEINELEEKMKLRLPNEVKAFYSRQNGGIPIQYIYWRDEDIYVLNHFLPIKYEMFEDLTIESVYQEMVNDEIFPVFYLPFALEEGGGYFLLSLTKEAYGYVYFWNPEYDDIEAFNDNIKIVADNFMAFCSYLTDKHPD